MASFMHMLLATPTISCTCWRPLMLILLVGINQSQCSMVMLLSNGVYFFSINDTWSCSPHYKCREDIMLTDYIIPDTKELKFSEMTRNENQVYKAFKEFHQQYIENGGKPAELPDIIHSIMGKAYPPIPPNDKTSYVKRRFYSSATRGALYHFTYTSPLQYDNPIQLSTILITSDVLPTIKQGPAKPEPEEK